MSTIWTIGHSNHSIDKFIAILQLFNIQLLADVRSMPGSVRLPHFNKPMLEAALKNAAIDYIHIPDLGGRTKPVFANYKAYMAGGKYKEWIAKLESMACDMPTAYMCAEADWQHCHRSYISDTLQQKGWEVIHITGTGKSVLHTNTRLGKPKQGSLFNS